ncbi:glycoside hydrolase [Guyanagaster necrorhizus]|uniref:glucan 1,3-beta-glucosidase n=1 Tax=Guyanagaster necrorhizus TaxID=856835 RepID=A0A9P7VJ96_9AGAR|nr:glycoside hydrolase [Guyanagaster necrorhizus MCA 3950]KAG7441041.1 glycoside hydrolase [Guyanagaster necrorhizus MCA 3950]
MGNREQTTNRYSLRSSRSRAVNYENGNAFLRPPHARYHNLTIQPEHLPPPSSPAINSSHLQQDRSNPPHPSSFFDTPNPTTTNKRPLRSSHAVDYKSSPDFLQPLPRTSFLHTPDPPSQHTLVAPSSSTPNTTTSAPLLYASIPTRKSPKPAQHGRSPTQRGLVFWLAGFLVFSSIVLAVVLPVYFTVVKPNENNANGSRGGSIAGKGSATPGAPNGDGTTSDQPSPTGDAITGGDGSVVTQEDGTTFIYNNSFGGYWVADPNDPFSGAARSNSWTPPLNESWKFGQDHVYGVNLGGWLVLEPFITPALYEKYDGAIDEWTLSQAMAADTANGGLNQLEEHYRTFITEKDFAEIASAGLNWVRLPIPYWAIDTWDREPFLAKTAWKQAFLCSFLYALKAFEWARKYGLRINLDLHTVPGSQNAYNHSGKKGQVNFLHGVMGYANAQRTLNYIRIITEFISQPQYRDVVLMFGIVNEPLLSSIGKTQLSSFYYEVYNMIRSITGLGAGHGPMISIHDGFAGAADWADFLPGSDRIALDVHSYLAFRGGPAAAPFVVGTGDDAGGMWPAKACEWGSDMNASQTAFGVTMAGEFSNGWNDCGYLLNGVGGEATFGGNCHKWEDASTWDEQTKAAVANFALASMDALRDWFFWTWKIGASPELGGVVGAPLWSYQLGLQGGWMPRDPRVALGKCEAVGVKPDPTPFGGTYEAWMTGGEGAGAGRVATSMMWPPETIRGADVAVTRLPAYTSAASVVALPPLPPPPETLTVTRSVDGGNGWYDAQDTGAGPMEVEGCVYPDAWGASGVGVPTVCGVGATSSGSSSKSGSGGATRVLGHTKTHTHTSTRTTMGNKATATATTKG